MPVAHDANAAYSVSRSDAKAKPPTKPPARQSSCAARCHVADLLPRAGKFYDHLTGTEQDATLDVMDHQGAGRTRPAADTRGQAPWPWLGSTDEPPDAPDPAAQPPLGGGSGAQPVPAAAAAPSPSSAAAAAPSPSSAAAAAAQPVLGRGSGAQRVLGPGTGPQRLIGSGSGAHAVLGTGAQPVPGGPRSPGTRSFVDLRGLVIFGAW